MEMTDTSDAVFVAEALLEKLGPEVISLVHRRIAECTRNGDASGADLWTQVASIIDRAAAVQPSPQATSPPPSSQLWRLMQHIEDCRHRAVLAERRAAELSTEQHREELQEIAEQWRRLAVRAEALAGWVLDPRAGTRR
jgi:hypothetical protein